MAELILFTDGSVNNRSNVGYGAYLATYEVGLPADSLRSCVKVKRFQHTTSTKLELQILLWALKDIQTSGHKVIVYTDSQNVVGLKERCNRLEQNDYRSKTGKYLKNYKLYIEFCRLTEQIDCEFIKVRGHRASNQKDEIDRLFALVDKASRDALRDNT